MLTHNILHAFLKWYISGTSARVPKKLNASGMATIESSESFLQCFWYVFLFLFDHQRRGLTPSRLGYQRLTLANTPWAVRTSGLAYIRSEYFPALPY